MGGGGGRKTQIMRAETLIVHLALYLIFITMSKTKHPGNMVLLTQKVNTLFTYLPN